MVKVKSVINELKDIATELEDPKLKEKLIDCLRCIIEHPTGSLIEYLQIIKFDKNYHDQILKHLHTYRREMNKTDIAIPLGLLRLIVKSECKAYRVSDGVPTSIG